MSYTTQLTLRISAKLDRQLEEAAKKLGIKKPDLIRDILNERTQQILISELCLNDTERDIILRELWRVSTYKEVEMKQRVVSGSREANLLNKGWDEAQEKGIGRNIYN